MMTHKSHHPINHLDLHNLKNPSNNNSNINKNFKVLIKLLLQGTKGNKRRKLKQSRKEKKVIN